MTRRGRSHTPSTRQPNESTFQTHVIQVARLNGFRANREDPLQPPLDLIMHIHDSRKSQGVGFPDLCLVRPAKIDEEGEIVAPARLIFAELKSSKGRIQPEQQLWLSALKTLGPPVEVFLWRPEDFEDIKRILGGTDNRLFV